MKSISKRVNELAREIALREGKKSQVRISDIREILKIMAVMHAEWCLDATAKDSSFIWDVIRYSQVPKIQRIAKKNLKVKK